MRVTTTYDRITATARRQFTCTVCGKRSAKSKTFGQTVNPFNKNAQGYVKTSAEIRAEVDAQAAAWRPDPVHDRCLPA